MAQQVGDGGVVGVLELQVAVLDVPDQQALALQVDADPLADGSDQRFQCLGPRRRQAAKHGSLAVDDIHPSRKSM